MSKMKLMANLPIYVDKIPIYSPVLLTIAELDQDKYAQMVNNCIISKELIIEDLKKEINGVMNYDLLLSMIGNRDNFLNEFLDSFFYFTKEKIHIASSMYTKDIVFTNGKLELNRNNYDEFIKAIKYVNCLGDTEEEELDEFDRLLLEREKKVQEAFNKNTEHIYLVDLVSAVANIEGNGLNIINIWQLNIYQFYEQMQRGQLKEQYDIAIKQLLAGANSDDVDVKYYFTNIK
jgi:hypothetical protein